MAVDTRDKRASIIGFNSFAQIVLPDPDSDVDRLDRMQLAVSYPGILPNLLQFRATPRRTFEPTTERTFAPTISDAEIATGGSRTWKADE